MKKIILISIVLCSAFGSLTSCSSQDEPLTDGDEYTSNLPKVYPDDFIFYSISADSLDSSFLSFLQSNRPKIGCYMKLGGIPNVEDENRRWDFSTALQFKEEEGTKSAQIVQSKGDVNVVACSFKISDESESRIFVLECIGNSNYMLYTTDDELIIGMRYDEGNSALICTHIPFSHYAYKILCSMATYMAGEWLCEVIAPETLGASEAVGMAWAVVSGLCC